jgi:uncharacterized membrane protein YeaQ/YmgE (transglycosylase-associated protein family)
MSFLAWIIVGLIAGWLAKTISPGPERAGLIATLLIGVIGAIAGGIIANALGYAGATGVNVYSIIVATLGAVLFLWIWKAFIARRPAS